VRIARRPSKFVLWRFLEADLRDIDGAVGIDAACATFKTFPLFRTASYYGIDLDLDAIRQGRREHPEAIGLVGDLAEIDLPRGSVDVCVSTNTFHWIPLDRRRLALERLADLVRADGSLILEAPINFCDDARAILSERFVNVDVRYFGNTLSYRYERWLIDRGFIERREGFFAAVRVATASLLGALELASQRSRRGKRWVYFRCRLRRDAPPPSEFRIDESRRLEDGVYAACTDDHHAPASVVQGPGQREPGFSTG
jgi:hypothetical protein